MGPLLALAALLAVQSPGEEFERSLATALEADEAKARRSAVISLVTSSRATVEQLLAAVPGAMKKPPPVPGTRVVEGPPGIHVYVPKTIDASKPAPLLLAFHGTGGSGADMEPMWRATADSLGMLVCAPSESGANEGYAFSERERAEALAALHWMRRSYDVDEDRIYATGISRGGHLVWDLALRHPDLFAAIAPMIGGPRFQLDAGQNNLRYLENVVALPIRDLQGSQDDPGLLANLRMAFDALAAKKAVDAKLVEFPELGHSFDLGAVDWVAFFSARRNPIPERVVRLAARRDEARSAWVEITKFTKEVQENFTPQVGASTWNALDENGKRKYLEKLVDQRTARLEVKRTGLGRFAAKGERVAGFRILLAAEMFDPAQPVQVLWNGKLVKKKVVPDPRVLAGDFAERFDRSFLPIASIDVP